MQQSCCRGVCIYIVASFSTYKECAAAKNSKNFPLSRTKTAKPAGAAGMKECRRRYGNAVSNATLSNDGKTLTCHYLDPAFSSNDPTVIRDACKKHYGPTSQTRQQSGKWYCTF
jgi:hypothetical protein